MAVLTVMHLLMRAVSAIIHTDVEIEVNDIGGSYMIKEIVKDTFLLSRRSEAATLQDMQTVLDLQDTLQAHADHCVGMAANMIGVLKRIIVFQDGGSYVTMLNSVIMKTGDKRYTAEEGCLCHSTQKKALRYEKIKVSYMDCSGKKKIKTYEGFCAQIIQHELDHCDGILI